ncbi:MAG: hypothetical protein A2X59_11675 [Nitrospirae bacterium GWC2_42_7]|nr:MAG: hypothetical protein A2X59_11675 [Nitrospirae bacterium GWC2_42_7]
MKTKKPETQPKKKKKDNSSIRNIHADHSKAFGDKGTICNEQPRSKLRGILNLPSLKGRGIRGG